MHPDGLDLIATRLSSGTFFIRETSMVFGQKKVKFDAQYGPAIGQEEVFQNPQAYTYVHNFKVHYKRGALQALANKTDISINSATPQLPDLQLVTDEFNKRMTASVVVSDTRRRYASVSFHITNVEYKESFAFLKPAGYYSGPPIQQPVLASPQAMAPPQNFQSRFCTGCGTRLDADSRFCKTCGRAVV
jgi:hypothetical protein